MNLGRRCEARGKINIDDYGIIDFNVTAQNLIFPTAGGVESVAAVPEPALAWFPRRRHAGWS